MSRRSTAASAAGGFAAGVGRTRAADIESTAAAAAQPAIREHFGATVRRSNSNVLVHY